MVDQDDSDPDEEDDDWFERAVRETDEEDEEPIEEEQRETQPESEAEPSDESPGGSGEAPDEPVPDQPPETQRDAEDFGFDAEPGDGDEFGSDFSAAFDEPGESPDESFGMDPGDASAGEESFGFDLGEGRDEAETFDDEEFESDIPRIDLGIQGLDEMIQGGVPERSLLVSIGGAGTGKTTFGLQFLAEALDNGERGVFITLEESHHRILQSAEEKGWDFEGYESDGQLAIIDLDPIEMANSLTSLRNELPRLIESFGASRLVLDSVSLLEMMYDDQSTRRTEIYDFTRSLKEAGVTTMLTSEADADNPFASRFGIIEYLTDGVFVLRHVRPDDFRETRLAIEIQKIRDAKHSRETKPFEITDTGISVYRQANIF
jgi:KaiC domain protein